MELEDMIEVLLADYNGEPHTGLYGRTPLEAMAHSVAQHGSRIRTLPVAARLNLCLLHEAKIVIIKGKPSTGLRPYINFISVRYTSPLLASSPALIGKKLRIYYDPRDIRVVKAFFDDGTELGILSAARPWCFTPHSLKVRREICRLIAERKLDIREGDNPIEAWARMRSEQRHNKVSAGLLAKQQRLEETSAANDDDGVNQPYIAPAPAAAAHAPHDRDPVLDVPSSTDNDEMTILPKTLTIRKTLTF
jgi:putative transposase